MTIEKYKYTLPLKLYFPLVKHTNPYNAQARFLANASWTLRTFKKTCIRKTSAKRCSSIPDTSLPLPTSETAPTRYRFALEIKSP